MIRLFSLLVVLAGACSMECSRAEALRPPGPEMISPDTIQFPNNPVSDFLMVYEKLKGVTLIKDASLLAGGINMSLTLNQPVSKEEAIRLIESTLLLNGYAFVAVDKKAIKVINAAGGKSPRSEGVYLFTNEQELPEGEVVASYVLPLSYLDANQAVEIFQQFVVLHPYGSIVAVPVANQVLITENSTLIRRLIEVRQLVDQPAPEMKSEFVQLHQADADRVVELLTEILKEREQSGSGSAGTGRPRAASGQPALPPGVPNPAAAGTAPGAAAAAGSGSASLAGIQLVADARTNRILVIARPFEVEYIKNLIRQFDIPVELDAPFECPLNYVSASSMLRILEKVLSEDDGGSSSSGGSQPTVTGGIGNTSGSSAGGSSNNAVGGYTARESPGTGTNAPNIKVKERGISDADSIIVGKTRLIADNRANSIIVIGQPEAREKVKSVLQRLDKRPYQINLATVIGSLTVNDKDDFSVNILQRMSVNENSGVNSVSGGTSKINTSSTTNSGGQLSGTTPLSQAATTMGALAGAATGALPGMQIATFIGNTLDMYINALTATTRFRISARPTVMTSNNRLATIWNGKQIAVPTSTLANAGGTGTTPIASVQSAVDFKYVVLQVDVIPLINSEREITLEIIQKNDTVLKSTTSIGGGVNVPEIATQLVNTSVTVPNGATILIGGLITQLDNQEVSGVPFLSTVPLLGNLFKSTADSVVREELVILIQPSVVVSPLEIQEVSDTERGLTEFSSRQITPSATKLGAAESALHLKAPKAEQPSE